MEPITRVLAGLVLAACLVLLLRMVVGARRRERFDAALRRLVVRLRRRGSAPAAAQPPRVDPREAARVADEAIRRAARRGRWEGNVYKPDAFRPPDDDRSGQPDRRKPH